MEMDSLSLRPETLADFGAIDSVHDAAFARPAEARLVRALRDSDAYVPELALVAVQGGQVVGHILITRVEIRSDTAVTPALALAPVAVLPALQGAGIGAALVRHGLAEARRLGHRLMIVLGHADYYPRFGFVAARPHEIEAPFQVPDDVWMVCELETDALAATRGTVIYPAPFDSV